MTLSAAEGRLWATPTTLKHPQGSTLTNVLSGHGHPDWGVRFSCQGPIGMTRDQLSMFRWKLTMTIYREDSQNERSKRHVLPLGISPLGMYLLQGSLSQLSSSQGHVCTCTYLLPIQDFPRLNWHVTWLTIDDCNDFYLSLLRMMDGKGIFFRWTFTFLGEMFNCSKLSRSNC